MPAKATTARRIDDKSGPKGPQAAAFEVEIEDFRPADFVGVIPRRMMAFLVDLAIIMVIFIAVMLIGTVLAVLSLGLLTPVLAISVPLVGFVYFTLMSGSPQSATVGMRMFGLELRTWDRRRPGYMQAAWHTVLFWASMGLTPLILLVAFFNQRNRCLHDFVAGTVMINAPE